MPSFDNDPSEVRTLALAALLLLSLVLPLVLTFQSRGGTLGMKSNVRLVWIGQGLAGLAGVCILVTRIHPFFFVAVGAVICLIFSFKLRRAAGIHGG